jgi:hypothetical protein
MRTIWVIYKNPTDYPNVPFVMREHRLEGGKVIPGSKTWQGSDISRVRQHIPKDRTKMARSEKDEPQIVEWWY